MSEDFFAYAFGALFTVLGIGSLGLVLFVIANSV
jgi:hypothetical protein